MRYPPGEDIKLIDEKKFELDTIKSDFQKIMPELELQANMQQRHDVRFYKGLEGLKTVYEDVIRTGQNYIGYGRGQPIEKVLKHYFKHFVNRRVKSKIRLRIIYDEASRNKVKINPLSEARYIPNQYCSNAALRIYGDKVALLLLSEEEPIAIVIKNKPIADGYRKYFEVMWKAAKQ